METLLIIDMQQGLFDSADRFDAGGVVQRINELSGQIRSSGGNVIFIQHDGTSGDPIEQGSPGWEILQELERDSEDKIIRKTACDAFYRTGLDNHLKKQGTGRLIITGCATDFCVDTTVRSAASLDYEIVAISDAHTTADRPHLKAESIIRHHNWVWENLILPDSRIRVVSTKEYLGTI